jgi:hypothetical protein
MEFCSLRKLGDDTPFLLQFVHLSNSGGRKKQLHDLSRSLVTITDLTVYVGEKSTTVDLKVKLHNYYDLMQEK